MALHAMTVIVVFALILCLKNTSAAPVVGQLATGQVLFICDYTNHRILRIVGSIVEPVVSGQPHVHFPDGVAFDKKDHKLYWTNMGAASEGTTGSIYRCTINDEMTCTDVEVVVPIGGGISTPKQLVFDEKHRCLYAGDKYPGTAGVYRVDLSESGATVVPLLQKHLGRGCGVMLDKSGERLFFSDETATGIGMMGRTIPVGETAANRTDLSYIYKTGSSPAHPLDIELDIEGNLYWSDIEYMYRPGSNAAVIREGNIEGAKQVSVATPSDLMNMMAVGVSVSGEEIYYGCMSLVSSTGAVYKNHINGGTQQLVYNSSTGGITGVLLVELDTYASPYCMPTDSCWPDKKTWESLSQAVGGRLFQKGMPEYENATEMKHPNWVDFEGHGKQLELPAYAVIVNSPSDVIASVRFASAHRIRLSVKSTGHDYNGRSTADGALLLFLHQYKKITWHDKFDDGCGNSAPAVTTEGGVLWWDLYPEFAERGVLSTGGNSLTVSVSGGYMLGGGHGAMAPVLGLAADNLMAAEVISADGNVHVVSPCKEPELFRALRGGGAGFGVVISATHKLHSAPPVTVGVDGFYPLGSPNIQGFIETYIQLYSRMDAHFGGYFLAIPNYGFVVRIVYLGDSYAEAAAAVAPLQAWMQVHKATGMYLNLSNHTSYWDWHGNTTDKTGDNFWGIGRLLPKSNFQDQASVTKLATFLLSTVKQGIGFQCDNTVGGVVSSFDPTGNETAVSPWMRSAVWHVFMYSGWGEAATPAQQQQLVNKMSAKQAELRDLAPISGSYWNEADYYESEWQTSFWGGSAQYNRLLALKKILDPQQLFTCHHCVGDGDV